MNYAVIVAGGNGSRMQSDTPKQFLSLHGLPVLMHTIRAFKHSGIELEILVVIAASHLKQWKDLCKQHLFEESHVVVQGGDTRFHSVKQALKYLKETYPQAKEDLVAIHDGARPLVESALIMRSFQEAALYGTSVAAIKSSDSVRISDENGGSATINRQNVHLIQTPQTFRLAELLKAYAQPYESLFTDDASVMEKNGYPIHLTRGDTRNIKITFNEDIALADFLLNLKETQRFKPPL
ncbi:2-C-methyl-D-erythritol 4-phosphate cytidylyltransferase [bacterium A37T11]|nr:2-C-methyl-D-erythritol 4-phosphate cytidylyltransferase [bacterium A37T11]